MDAPTAHPGARRELWDPGVPLHTARGFAPESGLRRPRARVGWGGGNVLIPFRNSPIGWSGEFLTAGVTGSPGAFALEAQRPRSPRVSQGEPRPGQGDAQPRPSSPPAPGLPAWAEGASSEGPARSPARGLQLGA